MGYLKIPNLYRPEAAPLLLFKELWALEKVHGTSAHLGHTPEKGLFFFAGGCPHDQFVKLFDPVVIERLSRGNCTIYGEAYGGKCQGMKKTYGDALRFIAFDVRIGDSWLAVPNAVEVATGIGLEFVPHEKVSCDLPALDAIRDRPSEVAKLRGITEDRPREGVVLRPFVELTMNNGSRLIAKHKGEAFAEREHVPKVGQPLEVLQAAEAIATEWVTPMRLDHLLGKGVDLTEQNIGKLIGLMTADIEVEGSGEIVASKEARQAIGKATAKLVKDRLRAAIQVQP